MIEWEDLVLPTAERFGGTIPHPDTATAIANVYAKAPHAVTKAIDRVAYEYEAGGIRSPWGILRSRVQQITANEKTTSKADDRDKDLERARQWLRTTGIHYDRASEIEDELFGERGALHAYRDNPTITAMIEIWHELRPLGVIVENELDERMARYRDQPKPEPAGKHGNLTADELRALASLKSQTPPATHILEPPLTT